VGKAPGGARSGQAMLESLIVLIVLLAGFLFFFDFAYGAVSRLLLANGAARAARADAVGYNYFHRSKALRVGMIPVSGRRLVPDGGRTVDGAAGELALVRTYLQSEDWPESYGILDYERWAGLSHTVRHDGGRCRVDASFATPRLTPWRLAALVGVDSPEGEEQTFKARWEIEDHASLYLKR